MHFPAAEVVDRGIPFLMKALARVGVLVQCGAVEPRQAMRIGREMPGHPVENHTDAGVMAAVDETRERRGLAEFRLRRILTEYLVAPGAAEWVTHDRQQLDMGELELAHVWDQLLGQLIPVQRLPIRALAPPGCGMHFVDRNGCVPLLAARAARLPPARIDTF